MLLVFIKKRLAEANDFMLRIIRKRLHSNKIH